MTRIVLMVAALGGLLHQVSHLNCPKSPPPPPPPPPLLPSLLPLQVMCCNLLQQFIAQQAKSSDSDSNPLPPSTAIPINYPIASIIVRSLARQSDISFHGNRRAFPNKQLHGFPVKVHLEQTKGEQCKEMLFVVELNRAAAGGRVAAIVHS